VLIDEPSVAARAILDAIVKVEALNADEARRLTEWLNEWLNDLDREGDACREVILAFLAVVREVNHE
jgi:hypothetical protein